MTAISQSHWGSKALFYTRIAWVLLHLFLFGIEYESQDANWYFLLVLCLIVGVIPQLVWLRTASTSSWLYPVTELIFSGSFLIIGTYVMGQYFSYLAIPAMCAAANIHTVRLRIPLWLWFSMLPAFAMTLVRPLSDFNVSIIEGFMFFGIGFGVWKVIETQHKMQLLLDENEQQRQVLEQYAKQVESITLLEERNRLARELHDTVGHTLTSVIMGLDAVSYLIKEYPEEAVANVNQLRTVTRNGLEEMREQIHHIAPERENESLDSQLGRIANAFAVHTGTCIEFESIGPIASTPLPVTMTLVRCLQESLTNAKRHGGAKHIRIVLTVQAEWINLTIHDNGCGMDEVRFGFGLQQMRERIEVYQGELELTSTLNAGTTVVCRLPLRNRKVG